MLFPNGPCCLLTGNPRPRGGVAPYTIDSGEHPLAAACAGRHRGSQRSTITIRKEIPMKSLSTRKPVLWFLFNASVALAVGIGGHHLHIHIHGHALHGSQQIMTSVGMGIVAL